MILDFSSAFHSDLQICQSTCTCTFRFIEAGSRIIETATYQLHGDETFQRAAACIGFERRQTTANGQQLAEMFLDAGELARAAIRDCSATEAVGTSFTVALTYTMPIANQFRIMRIGFQNM